MLAAGSTLGVYKILALLGAGGMGEVHRAHDPRLQRDIALKVLPDSLTADATARARLIREARAAAALSHPNICMVHEVGEADGHVYIAMELVEGEPLGERIGGKPLPVESVVRYGAQIAEALAHAHERHVIHRDLKSGNVMVTADGRVKVLDFGLAKRVWEVDEHGPTQPQVTLTETGVVVGTPHYLAPEVLHGARADAVSDVWALGVVLYEMTSGRLPFHGATTYELSSAIVNETVAPLPERVPAGLRAVISGCLAKQPGERIQRAGEVRAALEALQAGGMPVRPNTVEERMEPRPRRPRVVIALLAIAIVVLGAAAAWLTRERWLPRPRLREVQLTNQSWEIPLSGAALSPDGRMLLFDDWRGLRVMDLATKETRDISVPEPLRGRSISYDWRSDSRSFVVSGPWRAGLWEISVLSGKAAQIRATGTYPKVSPDGESIAFLDKDELWLMDATGVGAHKLGDVTNFFEMGWSPEGKRLAVVEGAKAGLTILDTQRGSRVRVLESEWFVGYWGGGGGIAWMEPRRLVVPMRDSTVSTNAWDLYELQLDARGTRVIGKPRRLTNWRDGTVAAFTLTSDHRKLALLRGWMQSDVYWADLSPGGERLGDLKRLTLDNGDKLPRGWTPASDGVFFTAGYSSDSTFGARIYRQQLDSPTAELVGHRSFSPQWDGGHWLYMMRVFGSARRMAGRTIQLTRTPVSGGAVEVVKEWQPPDDADSSGWWVAFEIPPITGVAAVVGEWVDSALVISRLDPATGATSEIMHLGWDDAFALSRDGERLAVWRGWGTMDLVDLRAKRISTLRPRPTGAGIATDSLVVQAAIWLPEGNGLLVSTYSPGGLWHVELNGRATRLYANRDYKNPWVGWPQLSPDGRKIALAKLTHQTNAWLIEGLK